MLSKKPMLVEKPIVGMRQQWNRVETDHVLMVGYNLRFHSCVKKARDWLNTGVIGKPLWARFTCAQFSDKAAYLGDGVILNWSHEIDLALYLLGPAQMVAASKVGSTTEVLADIILLHNPSKCQTTVHLDYLTKFERRGLVIVGDEGSIEADLVTRQALYRDNSGQIAESYSGRDSFDGNYLDEARCFLMRLDGDPVVGCTAPEAMRVVDICLQAKDYSYVK